MRPGQDPGPPSFGDRVAVIRDVVLVIIGTGVILMGAWAVVSRLAAVAVVLVLALMFTLFLAPYVAALENYTGRGVAVAAVVIGATAIFLGGGALVSTALIGQLAALAAHLPHELTRWVSSGPRILAVLNRLGITLKWATLQGRVLNSVGTVSSIILSGTLTAVLALASGLGAAAVTIFITVYLLLDARRIRRAVMRLVPRPYRVHLVALQATLSRVVRGYLRGQLILSVTVGAAFGLGCWALALPYPLAIGSFAALMELVPLLGPVLGAVLPVVLALLKQPLPLVPEVLLLYVLIQVLESQLIGPRVIRQQVGLHPVLSVVALMIGALLFGIWGALFAVPVAGLVAAAWLAGAEAWRSLIDDSPEARSSAEYTEP
jgi:predicted PurR-regulated permease PerM